MKGLSVWAERPVCLASPRSRPRGGGRGSRSPRAPILQGEKGAQQESDPKRPLREATGLLPSLRGRTPPSCPIQAGPRALSKHAPRAKSERGRGSRPQVFSPPPPHNSQEGRGSHSPIRILVVDVEPLRGAQELWGSEQEPSAHPSVTRPWLPLTPCSCPTHLPNPTDLLVCRKAPAPWPYSVLSRWLPALAHGLEGAEHRELLQQWPSFPGPPAQRVYRAKGAGRGDWHAMPSIDRPTSAWLAFLPERAKERVSLYRWAEGAGSERRGRPEADARVASRATAPSPTASLDGARWRRWRQADLHFAPRTSCVILDKSLNRSGSVSSSIQREGHRTCSQRLSTFVSMQK